MHSRFRMKGVLLAVLVALLANAALPGTASAEPQPGVRKKGFRLFARALGALVVNKVYCGLAADGRVCVDSTNSSTIGGGFWPKGTPDQYVFNSGLQVAGVIGTDGGPWASDTVGGFFFDPKGTTEHGEEVASIYNAANLDDLANWPAEACVPTEVNDSGGRLFDQILQGDPFNASGNCVGGRKSASQGDVWFMSWEGNNNLRGGRKHPIGLVVESRGMGWNFPAGNDDVLYFIYTFYNTSVIDGCPGGPTPGVNPYEAQGARPAIAAILCKQALALHAQIGATGVDLPDAGYTMTNLFAAFAADMDVAEAGSNYASVNLPFALGYTYDHSFSQPPTWSFDSRLFGAPFFQGSGFVGVKYLKSPTGAGAIQLFSNTVNGTPFAGAVNDPRDVSQLYRYLSGTQSVGAGDQACNTGNQVLTRVCFINNTSPQDMRFFQSSTPLTLAPGAQGSIVVAYIFAAPVATAGCGAGCDVKPGDPLKLTNAISLENLGANTIDSLTGFISFIDANADDIVDQGEFKVVPGSLLDKSLVAQAVFNNRFLLPFAPEVPSFFAIPGDNRVTILWQPSTSETSGDPFFSIASAIFVDSPGCPVPGTCPVPNNLYDPNYRANDVEGYRIYRGRVDSPSELTLLAQFDYSGTVISDFGGQINATDECAPEINVQTNCLDSGGNSITFDPVVPGVGRTTSTDWELSGNIVQVQFGKRAPLLNGKVIVSASDSAVSGGGSIGGCAPVACPALSNTGVPFVYEDATPRNNFRYFYSVTAFDINSFQSSPSSLESPRITKPVTPVAPSSNYSSVGQITNSDVFGRGTLMPQGALPSLDPVTGKFSGPFPAANGWDIGLGALVSEVLAQDGALAATLDSIVLGNPYGGNTPIVPHHYFFTASASGQTVQLDIPITQQQELGVESNAVGFLAVPIDSGLASAYGGNGNYKLPGQVGQSITGTDYVGLFGRGCVNGRPGFDTGAGCSYNGSRWFDGPSPTTNETVTDPIGCNTANFSNVVMPCYNNAGGLTGVTTIYQTQCYQSAGGNGCRQLDGVLAGAWRAGDFNVYWGNGGTIDSVVDVTHNVLVPGPADGYADHISATWGILNQSATSGTNPDGNAAILTNKDMACVEPLRTLAPGSFTCPGGTLAYLLSATAAPGAVGFFSGGGYPPIKPITAATNNGFVLYIVGEIFTFELNGGAAPANGTVWALRKYVGAITGGNGAGGSEGPYAYSHPEAVLPFTAIGAELRANYTVSNTLLDATSADLKKVHTVPDPYYVTNQFESSSDNKVIKFVNLPAQAIIRIYSSSGVLVNILEHNSSTFSGEETWNVRNRNNQVVASGVYFYHIEANGPTGKAARRIGRFTVVNFAQ